MIVQPTTVIGWHRKRGSELMARALVYVEELVRADEHVDEVR